jgi:hypothetical protein
LGSDHGCDGDQWIRFATDMEVQKLAIDLFDGRLTKLNCKLYKFPYWLFAQTGKQSKKKHFAANFNGLNSLSSLPLKNTSLNQENVDNILTSCMPISRMV